MFNHLNVKLPEITATTIDGVRLYETPEGNKYPSITTILSVRNKKGLMEWRKKVGNEVANYVAGKAAARGTAVHHMCEDFLNNNFDEEVHKKNFLPYVLFNQINLNRIFSFGLLLFLLNILLVLSVEIFGKEINGSKRWLDFGFLSLQPSEFMKITYALFVIQYLRFYSFKFSKFRSIFLLSVLFISALPIISQPDLGTGLVYIILGLMFLFICGMHRLYFIAMAIFGVLLSPLIYSFGLTSYQKGRIISWFSSGGLLGEGFLNSKQNEFNFLPEADTDFIFSIYAEQFGFIGVFLILILLGSFIVMTTLLTMSEKRLTNDLSPYYIGTYCTFVIGFSFLLNILMVSGMIPVVGLPLPFFTKGGSSLLCFSIMIGLIFTSREFLK